MCAPVMKCNVRRVPHTYIETFLITIRNYLESGRFSPEAFSQTMFYHIGIFRGGHVRIITEEETRFQINY